MTFGSRGPRERALTTSRVSRARTAWHATIGVAIVTTLAGCGSAYWTSGTGAVSARATVSVEGEAHVERRGGLVIVEQAPGAGFVMEGGLPSLVVDGELVATGASSTLVAGGRDALGAIVDASWTGSGSGAWGASGAASLPSAGIGASAGSASASPGAVVVGGGSVATGAASSSPGAMVVGGGSGGAGSASASPGAVVVGGGSGGAGSASASPVVGGASGDTAIAASAPLPPAGVGGGATVGGDASGDGAIVGASTGGSLEVEARVAVPRQGVFGVDGRPTALTAVIERGVQVDGVRVSLAELEALAQLALPEAPSAGLATDGAIEAWAELEHAALPAAGGETSIVVRLRGADPAEGAPLPRGRVRVHLVIDRSSSMQRAWPRVLASARLLIERLRPDDELHVVAYGSDAIEAWPLRRVGDGREAIDALEDISVGGGTHIEAGLRMAYAAAARARGDARGLVILLSDGVPNRGAFEPEALGGLAASARVASGSTTSVIGLGTEFDERLLRAVAREGRGGYHVSATVEGLGAELTAELDAHARVAARGVSLSLALGEGVEALDLSPDATRTPGGVELTLPALSAGEERRLVVRVRVPRSARARAVGQVSLAYRSAFDGHVVSAQKHLSVASGPRALAVSSGTAATGVIRASLAAALDRAGSAIRDGDARSAVEALHAHARLVEGRVEHVEHETLRAQARVTRRVATAVEALLPAASHPQRRQVALAFGSVAVRIGR